MIAAKPRLYADYNATAPLRPEASAAMHAAMASSANPSSVHAEGRAARAILEDARDRLSAVLQTRPADLVFTSGATEGLHLALEAAHAAGFGPLLLTGVEHDAVDAFVRSRSWAVSWIRVDGAGRIDLGSLEAAIAEARGARPVLALQAANNETGVIQPIARAQALVAEVGGAMIVDAAQALGKLDPQSWVGVGDWTVVSSAKVGGPSGVGAIALRPGTPVPLLRPGGGQERGRRAGSENVIGAAGFAAAAAAAAARTPGPWAAERDAFEAAAARAGAIAFGTDAARLDNTACVAMPGWSAERQVIALDLTGAAISAGAACTSGKVKSSRVLAAMGVAPDLAACAVRISFGWATTPGEGSRLSDLYTHAARRAGKLAATGGAYA